MFPLAPDSSRPPRALREALRNAVDLAIAFMTLESYGLDDLRRPSTHTGEHRRGRVRADDASAPQPSAATPRWSPGREHHPLDDLAASAAQSAATRADEIDAPRAAERDAIRAAEHNDTYRRQLGTPRRPRRPGTSASREQLCLSPLEPTPAPGPASPRRRATPQDASH